MILDISSYIGTALYRRLGSMSQPLIIIRDTIATLNGEILRYAIKSIIHVPAPGPGGPLRWHAVWPFHPRWSYP